MTVTLTGPSTSEVRVLIIAGQHGDEPLARQAVASLVEPGSGIPAHRLNCQLAVLSDANPDGAQAKTRENAWGLDLNRDHQQLRAPETQAIHHFVRRWQPSLILDVHTYPPRRKRLLAENLVYAHDLFLDIPSHPSLGLRSLNQLEKKLLNPLLRRNDAAGYLAGRYTLFTPGGRIRHSTPDVVDARNGLAVRTGVPTVLVEGRQPTRRDRHHSRGRTLAALRRACRTAIAWAGRHGPWLAQVQQATNGLHHVALGGRYLDAAEPLVMPFLDARHRTVREVQLPGRYAPKVVPQRCVKLPTAYAVPRSNQALVDTLAWHGLLPRTFALPQPACCTTYHIDHVVHSERSRRAPRELTIRSRATGWEPELYWRYPVTADSGRLLAVLLEPASKYGLARDEQIGLRWQAGQDYPVLRIETDA